MPLIVELLKDAKQKKVQETLLQYGIVPRTARAVATVELRNWSSEELSTILEKSSSRGPDLRSFDFASDGLLAGMASLLNLSGIRNPSWLKPSLELMERSAEDGSALCVNVSGEWALLKNGYFAISHVWEQGIQADPNNRGILLAHVQQIFKRIQQTGAKWIWLDGLAIPGSSRTLTLREEELKIAIINNLASIYQRANSVIIFDALVMQLQSIDLEAIAVCLVCGKWMTRVWTYQEICLAKKALIITGSGFVDFVDMSRRLRALSGLDGHLPEIFGVANHDLDEVAHGEKSSDKYEELYLTFARLLLMDGKKPSLTQLAMTCHDRKTGNDIDYARAFFPILGLTWRSNLTREEGMELIYNAQRYNAKRLVIMNGSPRSAFRPGWAPSYLTGLDGRPIGPDDPLGDIEWEERGLKRKWYTYKVKAQHPTGKANGLLLELSDSDSSGILCGCEISINERAESVDGFRDAVTKNSAYILSNKIISFPTRNGLGYNVMLVERNEEVSNIDEAWVYLTAAVTVLQKTLSAQPISWLLLHESPVGTHDRTGKDFSKIARMLSDETALHTGQSSLHTAAEAGDESSLRLLLANGDDIESRDERGWTPLHSAAFKGHILPVRLLLEHGASVDAEDNSERSPLMLAADEGHPDVAIELLQHGANVNLSRQNALSPLNQALMRSHIATVKILLDAGANPTGRDQFGFAPFLVACTKDVQFAELLIAAGADPTEDLVGGATVLHFAARAGNVALLERLLALDIGVDLTEGGTLGGITALFRAIEEQEEAAVTVLLSHGANPNHVMETTWTCVLQAAKLGNYNITKMVVRHGADLHTVCRPEGWTALHIACREGHRLVVRLLLDAGWEVNARDASGATPLQLASSAGHVAIVELLRKAGGV